MTPELDLTPATIQTGFATSTQISRERSDMTLELTHDRFAANICRAVCYAAGCAASRELDRIVKEHHQLNKGKPD